MAQRLGQFVGERGQVGGGRGGTAVRVEAEPTGRVDGRRTVVLDHSPTLGGPLGDGRPMIGRRAGTGGTGPSESGRPTGPGGTGRVASDGTAQGRPCQSG
ncbi:hypothetical protein GCM10010282_56710 [Streptomyces roseolus]|nr:hypothetical protein GCM10010282_56710 [Streptomyces roseolus]